MFGIGFTELLVIAIVALLFVGPKRLPEVMKQAGRFFVQMRRTANDVRSTFDGVVRQAESEIRQEEENTRRTLLADASPSTTAPAAPATTTTPHADGAKPTDGHGGSELPVEGFGANRPGSES